MKTTERHIPYIIGAVAVALLGLIIVQAVLLFDSYKEKEQAFDRTVMNALNTVAVLVEKEEAASRALDVAASMPAVSVGPAHRPLHIRKQTKNTATNFAWIVSDSGRAPATMRMEVFHSSGIDTVKTFIVNGRPTLPPGTRKFSYSYSTENGVVSVNASADDSIRLILQDTTKKRRSTIVANVVDQLFLTERLPLERRIPMPRLDSLVRTTLGAAGIHTPYALRVMVGEHDSIPLPGDSSQSAAFRMTPFKTRLFPGDFLSPKYEMAVVIPERGSVVLKSMTLLLALSIIFILLIVASFIYTVRVIVLQKRFASSIVDFINNMTHEFKTPISTIALAAEAIASPAAAKSRPKVLRYTSVIAEENNRMRQQAEKILQMAVLERGEVEMKREAVEMHDIITQAVKNFALTVEQKNGTIVADLTADRSALRGDPVHLTNIVHNLIDNAVKYSPVLPAITVRTRTDSSFLVLTVEDNGIGIAAADADRVFEKYFRVSTGNTHDVKGFGLGLSYVKLIAEAHGGTVSLASTKGKGTRVEVRLPL